MPVAGDQLIGREIIQELVEQCKVLAGLATIGAGLVVVARHQQRDRHVLHGVVHDRSIRNAPFLAGLSGWSWRQREERCIDTLASQVIFDREGHSTLETGGREDVALMAGVRQPLHDRAQALRHAGGWVADAVVIHEEEAHS